MKRRELRKYNRLQRELTKNRIIWEDVASAAFESGYEAAIEYMAFEEEMKRDRLPYGGKSFERAMKEYIDECIEGGMI